MIVHGLFFVKSLNQPPAWDTVFICPYITLGNRESVAYKGYHRNSSQV